MSRIKRAPTQHKGFTLIETMLAVALVGLYFGLISGLLPGIFKHVNRNKGNIAAMFIAETVLEDLLTRQPSNAHLAPGDYTALVDSAGQYLSSPDISGPNVYNVSWTVADNQPVTDFKTITVTVNRGLGGGVTLKSYRRSN